MAHPLHRHRKKNPFLPQSLRYMCFLAFWLVSFSWNMSTRAIKSAYCASFWSSCIAFTINGLFYFYLSVFCQPNGCCIIGRWRLTVNENTIRALLKSSWFGIGIDQLLVPSTWCLLLLACSSHYTWARVSKVHDVYTCYVDLVGTISQYVGLHTS